MPANLEPAETGWRLGMPVSALPGVGKRRAQQLARLDIHTLSDLLRHLPLRYQREHEEGGIADLPHDGVGTVRGTISAARWVPSIGRGKGRFEAALTQGMDRLALVWFNAAYLRQKLHPGMTIRVQGKVTLRMGYRQMVNPRWEILGSDDPEAAPALQQRLRPIYPATEDLPSATIETLVTGVLDPALVQVQDPLSKEDLQRLAMPGLAQAYRWAHQPEDEDQAGAARRRLAYNELLLLQLGIAIKRHHTRTRLQAPALRWSRAIDEHIRQRFAFTLTDAQDHVIGEIAADLQRTQPMNRLLQGDVGAGKTVVALYALLMAVADRRQGALMAPTELLAEQHHLSMAAALEGSNVQVALLTAGQAAAGSVARREILERIEAGDVDLVIGTQALVSQTVRFKDLAVVVVDEQHRFGVMQRAAFRSKAGDAQQDADAPQRSPHYLVMTATPIPRTLSLTVFGDLDVSTIHGLPPGRQPIATRVVPPERADEVYHYVAQRLAKGQQAYVVVPTIDESGHERAAELKNVNQHAKMLQDRHFADFKVETLHGRMKRATRESVMSRFRAGLVHVLVTTTVIEVGIDVPAATMMVVEHAERFGLAQLHQLRGRIGRGTTPVTSLCALIGDVTTEDAQRRLAAIAATRDGFRLAEEDLAIRGMGDFFGTRQHGAPPLRVARIPADMDLLQLAQREAQQIVDADPALAQPGHDLLRRVMMQQVGEALGLIDVG